MSEQQIAKYQRWLTTWGWYIAVGVGMVLVINVMWPRHHHIAARQLAFKPVVIPVAAPMDAERPNKDWATTPDPEPVLAPPTTQPTPQPSSTSVAKPQVTAAPAAPAIGAKSSDNVVYPTSFHFLSDFQYKIPDPNAIEVSSDLESKTAKEAPSIPAKIKALNGKKVGIQGFMIPLDMDAGKTKQFLLVAVVPGCLYCQPPQINEFVVVTMTGDRAVEYQNKSPVIVTGKLIVGEEKQGDTVTNIYRMVADDVVDGGMGKEPKGQF